MYKNGKKLLFFFYFKNVNFNFFSISYRLINDKQTLSLFVLLKNMPMLLGRVQIHEQMNDQVPSKQVKKIDLNT